MRSLKDLDPASETSWADAPQDGDGFRSAYRGMWNAWLKQKPDEAFPAGMALFAKHIPDPRLESRLVRWAMEMTRGSAGPSSLVPRKSIERPRWTPVFPFRIQ